jgi:hypothetical protein
MVCRFIVLDHKTFNDLYFTLPKFPSSTKTFIPSFLKSNPRSTIMSNKYVTSFRPFLLDSNAYIYLAPIK